MSGWVTALVGLGGAALGAGGSIYGSSIAANKAKGATSNPAVAGYDPQSNPLLALLAAQASTGLGFAPDQNVLMAASPLNRLETSLTQSLSGKGNAKSLHNMSTAIAKAHEILNQGGSTADAAAALQTALLTGTGGKKKKATGQSNVFNAALSSAGFTNIEDLLAQEQQYKTQAAQQTSLIGGQAPARFAARSAAEDTINKLMTDYPAYGASELDQAIADAMKPLNAQTLETANTYGYNPATNVALTQQQGIRDALSILGGRQQLSNTALQSLQVALGFQNQTALGIANQQQGAQANAANIASQQAMALNQLALQSGTYQGSALGSGIAGAGLTLGDYLTGLAQPGTSYRPGSPSTYSQFDYGGGGGGGYDYGPAK